jgi:hypothetical protein
MGFLDHSTNNIIVDAVLTDLGRKRLSQNDGSFSIVKFALGDDEIDYSIIKKFGLTVGREKIEKNTPIFEAQTSSNLGLKYKLISMSSQVETFIPSLVNTIADNSSSTNISTSNALTRVGQTPATVNLSQRIGTGNRVQQDGAIPIDMQESVFMVKASSRFLEVSSGAGVLPASYISERDQMATYRVAASAGGVKNSPSLSLTFKVKQTLNQTVFNTFGDSSGIITTVAVVTGLLTGIQHQITLPLKYSNDAT